MAKSHLTSESHPREPCEARQLYFVAYAQEPLGKIYTHLKRTYCGMKSKGKASISQSGPSPLRPSGKRTVVEE